MPRFVVEVSNRAWAKWKNRNGPVVQAAEDGASGNQTTDSAVLEALLATALSINLWDLQHLTQDTTTALLLAAGHVNVRELYRLEPEDED